MTDEERARLQKKVKELCERVEDLENERDAIKELPTAVAMLAGKVDTLRDIVLQGFDPRKKTIETSEGDIEKASSWDVAFKVAVSFILPILLAIISGYFLLKSQIPQTPPPPR